MSENFEIVKSVCTSNYEAITNIMKLYKIERFDLDCTYSKGNFWKNLPQPKYKSDIHPIDDTVLRASSEELPFDDNTLQSVIYDPPFVIVGSGKGHINNLKGSSIIAKRFEGYGTYDELKSNYFNSLKELYRIVSDNGFVVMKCQDTVSGGKQYLSHVMIINMATKIGFYPKDLFVLVSKVRVNAFNGTKWKEQRHARKYHSYFLVFQKTTPKVSLDWE